MEAFWKNKVAKKGTFAVKIVIKNLKHVLDYGNIPKHVSLKIKQMLLQRKKKNYLTG